MWDRGVEDRGLFGETSVTRQGIGAKRVGNVDRDDDGSQGAGTGGCFWGRVGKSDESTGEGTFREGSEKERGMVGPRPVGVRVHRGRVETDDGGQTRRQGRPISQGPPVPAPDKVETTRSPYIPPPPPPPITIITRRVGPLVRSVGGETRV